MPDLIDRRAVCAGPVPGADQQSLPRDLVHRSSIAEVFVTGVAAVDRGVHVTAQWPRSNRFHLSADGTRYDELLVVETLRQAVIATGHEVDDVAPGARFVMTRTSLELRPEALRLTGRPEHVVIALDRVPMTARRTRVEARITCSEALVGSGSAEVVVLPARAYARLRPLPAADPRSSPAPLLASSVPPGSVGRHFEQDVLVDSDPSRTGSCLLRVDPRHPVHFDHPQDHVPGMLMVDAARQVARLLRPGAAVTGLEARFGQFVELDQHCRLAVSAIGARSGLGGEVVESAFVQAGRPRARVRIGVRP